MFVAEARGVRAKARGESVVWFWVIMKVAGRGVTLQTKAARAVVTI